MSVELFSIACVLAIAAIFIVVNVRAFYKSRDGSWHVHGDTMRRSGKAGWETRPMTQSESEEEQRERAW